ncbi:MAG: hypothetical protein M3305_00075 [Actinomycetota bacterium]|nr:hypothetical protein [Actinomycetota bacterium]
MAQIVPRPITALYRSASSLSAQGLYTAERFVVRPDSQPEVQNLAPVFGAFVFPLELTAAPLAYLP